MNRTSSRVCIGPQRYRYRTVIEMPESPAGGLLGAEQHRLLLRVMADSPELIACAGEHPQKIKVTHTQGRWKAECETERIEPHVLE